MKKLIPLKVYYRIGVQLPFFFILVWALAFKLLTLLIPIAGITLDANHYVIISSVLSIIACLSVLRISIEKEMEKIDEPFSIVARDPNIPLVVDRITLKVVCARTLFSIYFALIVSIPLILIGFINIISGKSTVSEIVNEYGNFFLYYFIVWFLFALFGSFLYRPLIRNWHWTKHQFR